MEFVNTWRDHYKKIKPVPAKVLKDSPLFENVFEEGNLDLLKFPTPRWHERDGGRYIGTGSIDITADRDEGWTNWGTYRVMVHDSDTVGFYISPGKHGRIHRDKYQQTGDSFKMAMSFGHDPLVFLGGSIEVPYGVPEYDFLGGVRGATLEVVKAPYSRLMDPANAEILVEADLIIAEDRIEGPFRPVS